MQSVMKAGTDIDEEFDRASYVQHRDYKTHRMVHAAMEPHGAVATYRNGTYTIWMSTQMSFVDQFWYARCLGVGENQVRVINLLWAAVSAASWIPIPLAFALPRWRR